MRSVQSRSSAFLSNTIWSFLLQVANIVVAFVVPHALIVAFGSEINGLISSLTQFVSYISLVEAGISGAAVFALYEPLAKGDKHQVDVIVTAAKRFYYRSGGMFTCLMLGLAVVYPLMVSIDGLSNGEIFVITLSLGATGFLDFFTLAKYRVLLTASQRNWVIQIASIIYKVLYVVVIYGTIAVGMPIAIVYVAAVAPILIRSMILVIYTRKAFPNVDYSASDKGYQLEQRWDALVVQVLGAVQTGAPTLIATFVLRNLDLVSVFSVYLLVANGVQNLCSAISNGTQASFGDVIARNDIVTLQKVYNEMGVLTGIVSSVASGTGMVMILSFVGLYTKGVTDANYYQPIVGLLLMVNVFLFNLKACEGLLVIAAGKYRESRPYVSAQAAILLTASTMGCVWLGMEGIAIGCCLSNVYAAVYLNFFVPNRITHSKKLLTTKRYLVSIICIVPSVLLAAVNVVTAVSWSSWILKCLLCMTLFSIWSIVVFAIFERVPTRDLFLRAYRLLTRKVTRLER